MIQDLVLSSNIFQILGLSSFYHLNVLRTLLYKFDDAMMISKNLKQDLYSSQSTSSKKYLSNTGSIKSLSFVGLDILVTQD